jgi:hypothetical protein
MAPPTTAPITIFSRRSAAFFAFENGALVVPFHRRAVLVQQSLLSRLHGMHAAYRLLP